MAYMATLRWREAGSTPAWCAIMKQTLARKAFKDHIGQTNHFLVTLLVALDSLEANPSYQSPGLHAAWSPKSVTHSTQRSRIFAMHSFLGSVVDAIDIYCSLLNRKPDFLQSESLSQSIQACERSVFKKAATLGLFIPDIKIEAALVEVLITWRNNTMHELADNTLSEKSRNILRECAEEITKCYCNLDPAGLEAKANSGGDLTFKETASLINAAHKFTEKVDSFLLAKLNVVDFYSAALTDALRLNASNQGFRVRLFDVNSTRWNSFISNWASTTLRAPPLSDDDLLALRGLVPSLKLARSS